VAARDEVSEAQIDALMARLASARPSFSLPPAVLAHSRHYMPTKSGKGEGSTKVFDTFVDVGSGVLRVHWPVVLNDEEAGVLDLLLARLNYLGRAESWVEARRVSSVPEGELNAAPWTGEALLRGVSTTRVLCAMPSEAFAQWRRGLVPDAPPQSPPKRAGKGKAKAVKGPVIPATLREALEAESGDLRKDGWTQAPGSEWVDYVLPNDALAAKVRPFVRRQEDTVTVARFKIQSAVPPHFLHSLWVAERLHTALVSRSDGAVVFRGCDAHGAPLQGHQHAYLIPEANGQGPFVSHLTLWAPMGFSPEARQALKGLRKLWGQGGHDLHTTLLGFGSPADFGGKDTTRERSPLLAESDTWVSRTPFVPTRFPKRTRTGVPKCDASGLQIGSAEHDLRRLVVACGLAEPVEVERVEATWIAGKAVPWWRFRTERLAGEGRRGPRGAYGFRLRFARPVRGPLAFGYGAHFGLGHFIPET